MRSKFLRARLLTVLGLVMSGVSVVAAAPSAADVTFSLHRLAMVPTRPGNVQAHRTATHRGRLTFTAATPRGAKITGYEASCVSADNRDGLGAGAASGPFVLTGLRAGVRYFCKVRADSTAGPGRWSPDVTMPARPPA